MRRFMPLAVVVLAGLAVAAATVGSAGARSGDDKRCEDRLVQTLTVQMSSASPVNSLNLDTGETYFVYLNGPDLDTVFPHLNVNGTVLNWWDSHRDRRPGMVVSASPSGFRAGAGPGEVAWAQIQQGLGTLGGKQSCYVKPPARWKSLPSGSGNLSFTSNPPPGVTDSRTLTIQIYESVYTAPGPEQPPPGVPPPSVRYAITFSGGAPLNELANDVPNAYIKWVSVSGAGWISQSGASISGVDTLLIEQSGQPVIERTSFHLSSQPELPVEGWTRLAANVGSSDRACARKPGARVDVYLDGRKASGPFIGVEIPGCGDFDKLGLGGLPGSTAFVAFSRIKGKG